MTGPLINPLAEIERLRKVLEWYADDDRYQYDDTCCPMTEKDGVLADDGERARLALSLEEVNKWKCCAFCENIIECITQGECDKGHLPPIK